MDINNPWNLVIVIALLISALGHLLRMIDIIKKAGERKDKEEE